MAKNRKKKDVLTHDRLDKLEGMLQDLTETIAASDVHDADAFNANARANDNGCDEPEERNVRSVGDRLALYASGTGPF